MKENTDEKSLLKINENSMFYKIKKFFRKLFHKNYITEDIVTANMNDNIIADEEKRNLFIDEMKKVENEETKLLKLQKQYRSGKINEKDLSEEQVNSLCELYDKQIANLKKSNEIRKQKLVEYRKRLQIE